VNSADELTERDLVKQIAVLLYKRDRYAKMLEREHGYGYAAALTRLAMSDIDHAIAAVRQRIRLRRGEQAS
jgi:ABC-type Na+ transport system ATPase subunit NatA